MKRILCYGDSNTWGAWAGRDDRYDEKTRWGSRLRKLLESFASDYTGALWDMHHPYRDFNESADTTIKNLGTYVKHVHLRDSDDKDTYNLIGEGNVIHHRTEARQHGGNFLIIGIRAADAGSVPDVQQWHH